MLSVTTATDASPSVSPEQGGAPIVGWSVGAPARVARPGGAPVVAALLALLLALPVGGCGALRPALPEPPVQVPAQGTDGVAHVRLEHRRDAPPGPAPVFGVASGSTVELVVGSDVADRVVIGGLDRTLFVTAGATATIRFVAPGPARLTVTSSDRGGPIGYLDVR